MALSKEEIDAQVSGLIRKYDWYTTTLYNGVKLTVSDGEGEASVNITTGEDVESEVNRLIAEVDKHNYKELE